MIFATIRFGHNGTMGGEIPDPSFWVALANEVMKFIIALLNVEWTPARAGVFLIVVGVLLDGGGTYMLVSGEAKPRRGTKRRSKR